MRALTTILSIMTASPVMAQAYTALDGPLPDTVILADRWQMTPSTSDCTLIHRTAAGRPDLVIASRRDRDQSVFGLLLPPNAPYATAMQLTVVAQGLTSGKIGQVTFTPTHDRPATLLAAQWPTRNLMSRLKTVTGLSFYRGNGQLVAVLSFGSGGTAAGSFEQCLHNSTENTPSVPAAPAPERVFDVGWIPQFRPDACSIMRITRQGNELILKYTKRDGMIAVYRMHNGPRYDQDEAVPIRFGFWQSGGDGAPVELTSATMSVTMHSTNPGDGPLLFAPGSNPLIGKLRLPDLTTLTIRSAASPAGKVDDIVNLNGSAAATQGLAACMRAMHK